MLRQLPGPVPHIVVAHRPVGADITVSGVPGQPVEEQEVEGDSFQIRKFPGGAGRSTATSTTREQVGAQRRRGRRAASPRWSRRLAAAVRAGRRRRRGPGRSSPTGPATVADLVVTTDEGGRAAGGRPVSRSTARGRSWSPSTRPARSPRRSSKLEAASAHGLSVTGSALVVEALRKGQVETLVLADEPDDEKLLVGCSPLELGVHRADLDALGAQESHTVPGDRALVTAAVASGAGVVVLPRAAMPGDIPVAAILRYTDASTPSAQRTEEPTP